MALAGSDYWIRCYNKQTMIFCKQNFCWILYYGRRIYHPQFAVCKPATVGIETTSRERFRLWFVFSGRPDYPNNLSCPRAGIRVLYVAMELPRLAELRCIHCMLSRLFRLFSHKYLTQTCLQPLGSNDLFYLYYVFWRWGYQGNQRVW